MKLSKPMEDALLSMANGLQMTKHLRKFPGKANTANALLDRGLILSTPVNTGSGTEWTLTDTGWDEAERLNPTSCVCGGTTANHKRECPTQVVVLPDAPNLPTVAVPGYYWRFFDPQGGNPVNFDIIQLMYADDRTLSPAARLHRNADGTWHAEQGHAWGMSAIIAGGYQASMSVEECALIVATLADERGRAVVQRLLVEEREAREEELALLDDLDRHVASTAGRPAMVGVLVRRKPSLRGRRRRKGR